jgi:hypothetical protein
MNRRALKNSIDNGNEYFTVDGYMREPDEETDLDLLSLAELEPVEPVMSLSDWENADSQID